MSTEFKKLKLATSVSPYDQLVINQGTPPVTRRIAVGLVNTNQLAINDQTGASYTVQLTDVVSTIIRRNNASANTTVLPKNTTLNIPIGSVVQIMQYGAGASSFSSASGVTLRSSTATTTCKAQYSVLFARKIDTDAWVVYGDKT